MTPQKIAMQLQPVKSSNIKAVGYHPESKTLRVQFANDAVHEYANVEPHEHQALVNAPSIGSHFHKNIRARPSKRL